MTASEDEIGVSSLARQFCYLWGVFLLLEMWMAFHFVSLLVGAIQPAAASALFLCLTHPPGVDVVAIQDVLSYYTYRTEMMQLLSLIDSLLDSPYLHPGIG